MTTGGQLINRERNRQIEECKRTAEEDDQQDGAQLLACAERIIAEVLEEDDSDANRSSDYWPHDRASHVRRKYGADHIRRLTIAGALVAAEIDRLQRAQERTVPQHT